MDNYAVRNSSTVCYPPTKIADTVRCCALFAFKAARIAFSNTDQKRKLRWTFSKQIYCFRRKLLSRTAQRQHFRNLVAYNTSV